MLLVSSGYRTFENVGVNVRVVTLTSVVTSSMVVTFTVSKKL